MWFFRRHERQQWCDKFHFEDYYGSVITMAFTRSGRCTVLAAACVATVTLAACGQSAPRAASRLSATAPPSTTSTVPAISKSAPPPPLTTTMTTPPPKPSSTPKSTSTTSTRPLPPGALRLPSPHPFAAAQMRSGAVDIVTDAKHDCVWLQEQEPDGRKLAALWPPDHYALFDPLRVFDGTGREIWREGQLRHVGGPAEGINNIPKQCRVGDTAWLAPGEPHGFA